jgi:putative transcriptional regulator
MFGECLEMPHNVKHFCADVQNGLRAETLHASKMHERIRELREARGWSMRELAARTHSSASTINSLEKGKTQITVPWLERLAKAFEIPVAELAGFSSGQIWLGNDIAICDKVTPRVSRVQLKQNETLYRVISYALDQAGIALGTLIIVDTTPVGLNELKTGDFVIGQYPVGGEKLMLLRQFIEPSLLITNSISQNQPIINLRTESFRIEGLVVSAVGVFRDDLRTIEAA